MSPPPGCGEGKAGKISTKYGTSRSTKRCWRASVDELRLWIMPIVVGTGQRLFEDIDTSSLHLELIDVRKLTGGSAILTYIPSYTD